jgi:DNA-3-methyladenine glycosylase I
VARFDRRKLQRLMADPGIVRNRLKVTSAVSNAKAFLPVQEAFGTFDDFIWRFIGGPPRRNKWRAIKQVPARTAE